MQFDFATAGRIVFGPGKFKECGALTRSFGQRALVVYGKSPRHLSALELMLREQGIDCVSLPVPGEPEAGLVISGVDFGRTARCDVVIGLGGGSAIDAGKAIAAMLTNPGGLFDYLEVIGCGKPLPHPSAPFIAIPTTAGTGSEVTRNAVIASPEHRTKVSLRSPHMLPRVAVVDPELARGLPPGITASTGLDALTQLIEPFVSNRANAMTDAVCREGLLRAARSLAKAYHDGNDIAAREDMALASLFGGIALANAGLGAVHGFAGPLGGMYPAPHGALCAALLPPVMQVNVAALQHRSPGSASLRRFEEVSRILTGSREATAEDGIAWVQALVRDLRVPGLAAHGILRADFAEIRAKAQAASSMKANPIVLTPEELDEILGRAS